VSPMCGGNQSWRPGRIAGVASATVDVEGVAVERGQG
jgi:hypothetical protein